MIGVDGPRNMQALSGQKIGALAGDDRAALQIAQCAGVTNRDPAKTHAEVWLLIDARYRPTSPIAQSCRDCL
jgi:hypothetical protein